MIVDAHIHVWRAMPDFPNPKGPMVSPLSDAPVELFRQYMDEHGVERAVLVQSTYTGEDNSYVADCAAADPQRFAAVCVVDPRTPGAEDRLEYWVRERGCKGLRLRPRLPAESAVFGDPSTYPLWEKASALGVVVKVFGNPEHLPIVAALAERFPDVTILLDHFAHPDPTAGVGAPGFQALLDLARYPRISVYASGYYYYSKQPYPFADCGDLFRALYDRFGAARLLWGSDFPHVLLKIGYRRNLMFQQRAYPFLTPTDLDQMMGGNAAKLFWS